MRLILSAIPATRLSHKITCPAKYHDHVERTVAFTSKGQGHKRWAIRPRSLHRNCLEITAGNIDQLRPDEGRWGGGCHEL